MPSWETDAHRGVSCLLGKESPCSTPVVWHDSGHEDKSGEPGSSAPPGRYVRSDKPLTSSAHEVTSAPLSGSSQRRPSGQFPSSIGGFGTTCNSVLTRTLRSLR